MKIPTSALPTLARLLDEVFDLDLDERERWFLQLGEPYKQFEPTLRDMLERRGAIETGDFLETLPKLGTSEELGPGQLVVGQTIGPYTLLKPLGRGGMAEVWLARRSDGSLKRQVALKMPHPFLSDIKHHRFMRERDILAALSHSNIAQLYDAAIGHERPYLVVEYIDGLPITQYCSEQHVSLTNRLALFQQVLKGVDFAHARFIAHRDLKPGNILVTREGEVKLLDFGIAKLLGEDRAGGEIALTQLGGRAATPQYAAPEQLTDQPISTAVDLYACGVVLFELLSGRRPPPASVRLQTRRDSPLVSRHLSVTEANTVGGLSHTDLQRALRGDLDAIVAKALELDPELRYRSAGAMAEDLQRAQRHEPISARHISRAALAGKFVRRHVLAVVLVVIASVSLCGGTVAVLIANGRVRAEAARAESAAQRAELEVHRQSVAKNFLVSIFAESDPRLKSDKPRSALTADELLANSASHIEHDFAQDPEAQIDLLRTVTDIFDAQQDIVHYAPLHKRYAELVKERYGENDVRYVEAEIEEADHALDQGLTASAAQLLDSVDVLLKRNGLDRTRQRALWYEAKSTQLRAKDADSPERVKYLEQAKGLFAELAPTDEVYASVLSSLGGVRLRNDDNIGAEALYRRAIEVIRARNGADYGELSVLYLNLAQAQQGAGEFDAALASLDQSLRVLGETYGEKHATYIETQMIYAEYLHLRGRREEALAKFDPAIRNLPPEQKGYPDAFAAQVAAVFREKFGLCLLREGRSQAAIPYLAAAIRIYASQPMYSNEREAFALHLKLGDALASTGNWSVARREILGTLEHLIASRPADDALLLQGREILGRYWLARGDGERATAQFRKVQQSATAAGSETLARALAGLSLAATNSGELSVADSLSGQAISIVQKDPTVADVRVLPYLWHVRARVLFKSGQQVEARSLAERALDAHRRYDGADSDSVKADTSLLSEISAHPAAISSPPG